MRSLIILPTYNEAQNLEKVVNGINMANSYEDRHLLIIDDNSSDGTREIAKGLVKKHSRVIFLKERPGKLGLGSAYIEGFKFALANKYDYVFEMDADLSHDPQEIPIFLKAAKEVDVVIGSRYIGGIRIMNWPLSRLALSYFANMYARFMSGLKLTDCTSGYKCFSHKVLEALPLDKIISQGYGFQIEVNFWCAKLGFKIKEIPIVFTERKAGSSKMSKKIVREAFWLGVRLFFDRLLRFVRNDRRDRFVRKENYE